jgi:hypothetical protein
VDTGTDASEFLSLSQEEVLQEPSRTVQRSLKGGREDAPVPRLEMETVADPVMPEAEVVQEPAPGPVVSDGAGGQAEPPHLEAEQEEPPVLKLEMEAAAPVIRDVDAVQEAAPDQAESAVEDGRAEPPRSDAERVEPLEPPVKQAPPAFVEFQPAGRPPEAPEARRDEPEMDRTLRIERKTLEEAAAANGLSLQPAGDIGEAGTKPESGSLPSAVRPTSPRSPVLIGLILCLALSLIAFGYFLVRPDDGQRWVRWLSANVPFAGQYLEVGRPDRNPWWSR